MPLTFGEVKQVLRDIADGIPANEERGHDERAALFYAIGVMGEIQDANGMDDNELCIS